MARKRTLNGLKLSPVAEDYIDRLIEAIKDRKQNNMCENFALIEIDGVPILGLENQGKIIYLPFTDELIRQYNDFFIRKLADTHSGEMFR